MRPLLLTCLVALLYAAPGRGSLVSLWVFDGTANVPVSSEAAGVNAGNLTQFGLTPVVNSIQFSASDWPVGSFGTAYLEWTVGSDYGIDYTTVTWDYVIGTNPSFMTELRTDLDGYTSALSSHLNNPGSSSYSDPLAALGIQYGTVTFRMYGYVDSTSGSSGLYAGNMSFNATGNAVLTTPEPSSLWLLATGLLGFAGWWRFRLPLRSTSSPSRR